MEGELEVLRTIYDIDFSISNTFPARYGIVVSADTDTETSDWRVSNAWSSDASQLQVLFEPPAGYPADPVKIRVASLFASPAVSEQLESLEELLNERARYLAEFEEMAMYEVAETARAWLWERANQASFLSEKSWNGIIINEALDWDMQSISPSTIVTHQLKTERKVMLMVREECSIDITIAQARKSLRSSLWDVKEAVDSIKKDLKRFQEQAHTCNSDEAENHTCGICFDELETDGDCVVFAPCHHVACIDCFTQYIAIKITEKQVWNMTCPADAKCRVLVDPITIGWLLSKDLSEKYSFWFRQSFIDLQQKPDSKRRYFWCPNRYCQNAISVKVAGRTKAAAPLPQVLHCAGCSVTRCAECEYLGGHWPATCEDIKAYQLLSGQVDISPPKSLDEEEMATKRCPKCCIMITKNGGCPHMHCASCGFDFCWQCGIYWFDPQHSSVYPFKCTGEDREGKMTAVVFDNFTWDDTSDDWPAQCKRRVLSHEALLRRETSGRNHTNILSSKVDPQLKDVISGLLADIHYILKNVSVFLFTHHKKRSAVVKRISEISNRFEIQLMSLEALRTSSLRGGKDRRNSSSKFVVMHMKPESLYHEIMRERGQLVANIKLLAIAMGNEERS